MSICVRCGAAFSCAMMGEQDGPCWCTALPAVMPVPGLPAGCYCPGCLKLQIALQGGDPEPPHE